MGKIPGLPGYVMGLSIYINTREAKNERPHVHIGRGRKKSEKDLKLWLDTMEYSDDQAIDGFTLRELREMRAFVERTKDLCLAHWVHLHGKPKKRG